MITLLTGENSYEIEQRLRQLSAEFDGTPERFDGAELEVRMLPDLLMGVSLFAQQRLVVVRGLGQDKAVWEVLPDWLARASDDTHLVLVEPKPDKRTRTWKALQKAATLEDYPAWTDRESTRAVQWARDEAAARGLRLEATEARLLVGRTGVDQWAIHHALDKLAALERADAATIEQVVEARPQENIFMLFEAALAGDAARVQAMLAVLRLSEDAYATLGLLSGQAVQLAALAVAGEGDNVAKDFGVHPYALGKLRPHAERRGAAGARAVVAALAEADDALKTSGIAPWLAVERALVKVATASSR